MATTDSTNECEERASITKLDRIASPFLRLPGELRNKIYKTIFSSNTVVAMHPEFRKPLLVGTPALLLVCRQIFTEAEKLFWRYTTFLVKNAQRFVEQVAGERRSKLITTFTLTSTAAAAFSHGMPLLLRLRDEVENSFPRALESLERVNIVGISRRKALRREQIEGRLRTWFDTANLEIVHVQSQSGHEHVFC